MVMVNTGSKVVVADSDRTVLELLQIRLDVAGYHACVARNGPAVLETLKYLRPSALVIDVALAEMNGFEVLEALSRRPERLPPTLVVGRKLAAEDITKALSLGARDCMTKPFSGADVLDRIGRLVRDPGLGVPARRVQWIDA
jgi:DNA-binding response OmpR family regulator